MRKHVHIFLGLFLIASSGAFAAVVLLGVVNMPQPARADAVTYPSMASPSESAAACSGTDQLWNVLAADGSCMAEGGCAAPQPSTICCPQGWTAHNSDGSYQFNLCYQPVPPFIATVCYIQTPYCSPPTATGTITVTSENDVVTSTLVDADWSQDAFAGSAENPCSVGPCTGTSSTYDNMLTGPYSLSSIPIVARQSNYALRGVEQGSVAFQPSGQLFSFLSELVHHAEAKTVCGYLNSGGCSLDSRLSVTALTLPASQTAHFVIYWDPVATIKLDTTAVSSTVAAGVSATMNVTIKNGGAQGSKLDWSASTSTLPSWLTVWPATGRLVAGNSQELDFIANSSGLAAGATSTTVTISGTSLPSLPSFNLPSKPITVTFTVGAPPPPPSPPASPPSCTFSASPQQIIPPEQSTLSWACTNAVSCRLDGDLVPMNDNETVSPTANTTYTLTCQGSGSGPTNTVTTQTTVTTRSTNIHEINP